MYCEACEHKVATVHLTEIVNKKKKELHLCEECAREKGVSVKSAFSVQEVSSEVTPPAKPGAGGGPAEQAVPGEPGAVPSLPALAKDGAGVPLPSGAGSGLGLAGPSCPVCGITFAEVRSSGRLGCANDYTTFKKQLLPLLEKIHSHTEHRGKVPTQIGQRLERQKKLAALRQALGKAIQKEDYEKAAELRDQIFAIEERA